MPIDKTEFESGKILSEVEKAVISFLKKNPAKAFTSGEIMEGINMQRDFCDFWKAIVSGIQILGFISILNNLVTTGKIRVNVVNGTYYYMAK